MFLVILLTKILSFEDNNFRYRKKATSCKAILLTLLSETS